MPRRHQSGLGKIVVVALAAILATLGAELIRERTAAKAIGGLVYLGATPAARWGLFLLITGIAGTTGLLAFVGLLRNRIASAGLPPEHRIVLASIESDKHKKTLYVMAGVFAMCVLVGQLGLIADARGARFSARRDLDSKVQELVDLAIAATTPKGGLGPKGILDEPADIAQARNILSRVSTLLDSDRGDLTTDELSRLKLAGIHLHIVLGEYAEADGWLTSMVGRMPKRYEVGYRDAEAYIRRKTGRPPIATGNRLTDDVELADWYDDHDRPSEALGVLEPCLAYFSCGGNLEPGDLVSLVNGYGLAARCSLGMPTPDGAKVRRYAEAGLALAQRGDESPGLSARQRTSLDRARVECLRAMGEWAVSQKDWPTARDRIDSAATLAEEMITQRAVTSMRVVAAELLHELEQIGVDLQDPDLVASTRRRLTILG